MMKNLKYIIYLVFFLGICLHIFHVFTAFISSEGISSFSLGVLAWSLVPYIICLIILKSVGTPMKVLVASLLVLIVDAWVHVEVFITPAGSTAAVGLAVMPFWNIVIVIPIGCLLGWFIENYFKIEAVKKT